MTSLNVSSSSKSEEFNLKDIQVLVDNEKQPWFKQAHTGKYISISHIDKFTAKLGQDDKQTRASSKARPTPYTMGSSPGPKDHKKDSQFLIIYCYPLVISYCTPLKIQR